MDRAKQLASQFFIATAAEPELAADSLINLFHQHPATEPNPRIHADDNLKMCIHTSVAKLLANDNFENRKRIFETAMKHRELFKPRFDITLDQQRHLALQRLHVLCNANIVSVYDFENNPNNIFTAHECIGILDTSLATKFTVQFNLFGGTLLRLGTTKHHSILPHIDDLSQVGCFALTELGYGNNAVELETTATYDPTTDEFVINTPTPLSQKYWVTNGALHAHWSIVFAQMVIGGDSKGVHPFLVKIRDIATMKPTDGVLIRDMGLKIGCNGVDNARICFTGVRVSREALLDSVSQVLPGGTFVSGLKSKRQRFLLQADQLLSGRVCVASMMLGGCKLILTMTARYSSTRLSVGPTGGSSDTAILSYGLQQRTLLPLIAKTYVSNFFLSRCKEKLSYLLKKEKVTSEGDRKQESLSGVSDELLNFEVMLLCCAVKPFIAWHSGSVATICRERTGGQGYLSCNLYGEYIAAAHAGMTVEGDARVLWQKVAKELLGAFQKEKTQGDSADVWKPRLGLAGRLRLAAERQGRPPPTFAFPSVAYISKVLEVRERSKLEQLAKKMEKSVEEELTAAKGSGGMRQAIFDAWVMKCPRHVQEVAQAFTEREAFESTIDAVIVAHMEDSTSSEEKDRASVEAISTRKSSLAVSQIIVKVAALFGLQCLADDCPWLVGNHVMNVEEMSQLQAAIDKVTDHFCSPDGQEIMHMVEAFGVPERLLFAPIAQSNWAEVLTQN